MHCLETSQDLNEDHPDLTLLKGCPILLMITYSLEQVSIIRILHYYTTLYVNQPLLTYQSDCVLGSMNASL